MHVPSKRGLRSKGSAKREEEEKKSKKKLDPQEEKRRSFEGLKEALRQKGHPETLISKMKYPGEALEAFANLRTPGAPRKQDTIAAGVKSKKRFRDTSPVSNQELS